MDWREIQLDGTLAFVFSVSTAYSLEIISGSVYGVNFGDLVVSNPQITIASALSILALGAVWLVNQPRIDSLDLEERVLVLVSVGLVVAQMFAPQYAPGLLSPLYSSYLAGTLALMAEAAGFWTVATA